MKKILDQTIVVPIVALYYSIGLYLALRLDIAVNYYFYAFLIVLGLVIQYLRDIQNKQTKQINTACFIVTIIVLIALLYNQILTIIGGTLSSIINFDFTYLTNAFKGIFNKSLLISVFYLFSFIFIRSIYQDVIVEKKIAIFSNFSLIICFVGWITTKNIYIENVAIIALALLLNIIRSTYNNINSVGGTKTCLLCLVFVCCFVLAYLLSPYVEKFSVKATANTIYTEAKEIINEVINQGKLELDGNLPEMQLKQSEELSDEIVMTINSTYKIDRIKAYSCSKYDVNRNTFIMDKKINLDKNNNFTSLFIRQDKFELPEYLHVTINKHLDDVVYIPYGDLSFSQKVYLYNDQVIQFKNKEDYDDYALTFDPTSYNQTPTTADLIRKYKEYAINNYADKTKTNILPYEIEKAIESFIEEDPSYKEFVFDNDEENNSTNSKVILDRLNVDKINNYLAKMFTIKKAYERNNERIDDISYALKNEHIANEQLMAAIATFMYRYENIPSRFVVGYSIDEYSGNIAYIRENNKTYWSEVYIDGMWLPSDDLYMPVGEGLKTDSSSDSKGLSQMDGVLDNTYNDFSNSDEEEETALIIETNYEVEKVKQTSYGNYNPTKHAFEYEENISNYRSIRNADVVYNMDNFFKDLFVIKGNYKYYMKVTSNISTNSAYVPYGKINIQNVSMFQDKAILFDENASSYVINFEPYTNEDQFKSNSFYDDYVYEKYLSVPSEMVKQLQDFLLSKGIDYKSKDKTLLIRQIKDLLQEGEYLYTINPGSVPEGEDMLLYFLLENKRGFCQHFAGAATLLYRICGIPARYTVGFSINGYENGIAVVKTTDAHAWTEIYTKNYGWKAIEVTSSLKENNLDYTLSIIENQENGEEKQTSNEQVLSENNSDKYNTQPESLLSNQSIVDDNYTIVNSSDSDTDEDKVLLSLTTNADINRIKAYSLGNYSPDNQAFFLGEDLSGQKDIMKIGNIFDIDQYFISLFTKDEELEYEFNAKVYDDEKWLYAPYGIINIEEADMYQDKYFYFNDEAKYDEYSLTYSIPNIENEFDEHHDYENFVYNYYTTIPYNFKTVLSDYLIEKKINPKFNDKLAIIKKIQDLLITKYIYVEKIGDSVDDIDDTLSFIVRTRTGDDELYANGATMLFRMCGIPARRADGFYLGDSDDGSYELKNNDKHSWVEVYTSNLGWAPIEVCPKYDCEDIEGYKFVRTINEEDEVELVDIETKQQTKKSISTIGILGALVIILIVIFTIKKKQDEYQARLKMIGIENEEQLKLLKDINSNYLLLKQHSYTNAEIEFIMLRIRFSKRRETREDLQIILDRVRQMKLEQKNNKFKNRFVKRKNDTNE